MAIFSVIVYHSSKVKYEIEAKDSDQAGEKAEEQCQEEHSPDNIDDIDVELSDNQYTDQQELLDRERDSEIWKGVLNVKYWNQRSFVIIVVRIYERSHTINANVDHKSIIVISIVVIVAQRIK